MLPDTGAGCGRKGRDIIAKGRAGISDHDSQYVTTTTIDVAVGAGLPTRALITDMNQVLGHTAGNALEVQEAIQFLTGAVQEPRQLGVTLMLAAELLQLGGLAPNVLAGRRMAQAALDSGQAAERFARMVAALGGPADVLQRANLPVAPLQVPVPALRSGFISHIDVRALGLAVVALGGGRVRPATAVDPRVGLAAVQPLGAAVATGQSLAVVHAARVVDVQGVVLAVQQAMTVADRAPDPTPVVLASVG